MGEPNRAFALLCLGALLFAAAYALSAAYELEFPLELEIFTILFGLPYALWELSRRTNWLLVLYLVVLIPAFHRLATHAAVRTHEKIGGDEAMLIAGLAGGLVGAGLSFLILTVPALRAPTARATLLIGAGLIVLTLWGGIGLDQADMESRYGLLVLYLPWQIAFAFFLSRLLRQSPPSARR